MGSNATPMSEQARPDPVEPRLTEARNPRTRGIDGAEPAEIVRMIQAEDRAVPPAVESQAPQIAELVERVEAKLRAGGRLFYLGAGTSGRLGVLDASECPPTFRTDPAMVQGIIAGGATALVRSREGAEDDREAGRRAIEEAGVGPSDFVLGIATSGTTPFVLAGVEEAARRGAATGFLSCTPPPGEMLRVADVLVTPLVGPEVIAGSTRMKAGTATKLVLNTLTTAVMIRLGKVYRNLMVDLSAGSRKLVRRSLAILDEVCGLGEPDARALLARSGGSVKTAIAMHEIRIDRARAERTLDACEGRLADALRRFGPEAPPPYYAAYAPPEPAAEESGASSALRARLAAGPEAVEVSLRRREAEGEGLDGRHPWPPASHVAHLLEFEEDAITDRVRRWLSEDSPVLVDWEPPDPPRGADEPAAELLSRWRITRGRTVALLEDLPVGALGRRARLGEEEVTLYQFLRGVAQHDRAHALRISERLHPELR